MGFLGSIKKVFAQTTNEEKVNASSEGGSRSLTGNDSSRQLAKGVRYYDIVGESFHAEAFEEIRIELGASPSETVEAEAWLKNDPKNPYAKNGKAVAVYLSDRLVGYIANNDSATMFDLLKSRGGVGSCGSSVFFDVESERPLNSVRLHIAWPPKFADQEMGNVADAPGRNAVLSVNQPKNVEPLGDQLKFQNLTFLNGMPKEFVQFEGGFNLVAKLMKAGLEVDDKLVFDNSSHLSSLVTTKHHALSEGHIGLLLLGELVATFFDSADPRLFDLIEKHGGVAAAHSEIKITSSGANYIVNVAGAKPSSAQANRSPRSPLLTGSFTGIAEVDTEVTSRSGDNLNYVAHDLLKLDVGNTAVVLGSICLFYSQRSDNVFVQYGDTIGGVEGDAKELLRPFVEKYGYDDDSQTSIAAWLMITRKSSKKIRVDLVLDNPLKISA